MQPEPVIATAVAHFKRSREAERARLEVCADAKARTRLASADEFDAVREAEDRATLVWYDQRKVAQQAAIDLCAALGIAPGDLKEML